jgi:phytoene synthase
MRREMCVLYAFMRRTDDLGDDESQTLEARRQALAAWRSAVRQAAGGAARIEAACPPEALAGLPALADVLNRRGIPPGLLDDVINGVESDLAPREFQAFSELERYCYQVAGAVGLCCLHVWGFEGDAARQRAIDCGIAFQLTNILRDLQEDARRSRSYLPREDLARFGVRAEDFREGRMTADFARLMEFEVARARQYYESGRLLLPCLSRPGQRVHAAMLGIYGGLLDEIARRGYDVFKRRVELPTSRKLSIALRSWWRPAAVVDRPEPAGR